MNITSVNNFRQINNNQKQQTQSFKKVFPVKVLIDNVPVTDKNVIQNALNKLYNILFDSNKSMVKNTLKTTVNDLNTDFSNKHKKKYCITSSSIDGQHYLFTGKDAEALARISDEFSFVKNWDLKEKKQQYMNQVERLVNSNSRLKEIGTGIKLGLHIMAEKIPKKKSLKIIDAKFRKIINSSYKSVQPGTKNPQLCLNLN